MNPLVAVTFVVTFLIVGVTAYLLLPRPKVDSRPASTGLSGAGNAPTSTQRVPGLGVKLLLASVMLVLVPFVWFVFSRPGGASLLALVVIVIGYPLAKRFRRPDRFRVGLALIALALLTFWPMQYFAARVDRPFSEYNVILHGLGLFISGTLLAAGLETMRRASKNAEG